MNPRAQSTLPSPQMIEELAATPRPELLPACPFPGINPFTYADRAVFFSREQETRTLTHLIIMYRGALLYSESGAGKSSVINASLIPAAIDEHLQPERIRVEPKPGAEIVIERILEDPGKGTYLPSIFPFGDHENRTVLSVERFLETVRRASASARPLLIFDQFEEWFTLFEEGSPGYARDQLEASRAKILAAIVSLINESSLPVTVLIALREDYLAKLNPLFQHCPNLPDHYLRLTSLSGDQVYRTVRGVYERFRGSYSPEISAALAKTIKEQFENRSGGDIRLTEVQIVCRSLFDAGTRGEQQEAFFQSHGGVQGILEDYLKQALEKMNSEEQAPAISLLAHMITSAGTRNVISEEDLISRVMQEEPVARDLLERTLVSLDRQAKLVRREARHEVSYYEIASEFLVPWIRGKSLERQQMLQRRKEEEERRALERAKSARRMMRGIVALAIVVALLTIAWTIAIVQTRDAKRLRGIAETNALKAKDKADLAARREKESQENADLAEISRAEAVKQQEAAEKATSLAKRQATSRMLTTASINIANVDPDLSILLARDAVKQEATPEAVGQLRRAVQISRALFTKTVYGSVPRDIVFSADGKRMATANSDDTARIWDASTGREIRAFYGHADRVEAVAFSPDGATLATASRDGTAKVWDAHTGQELRTLAGHLGNVTVIAFGKDNVLATASTDGTAKLWDVKSGKLLRTLTGHAQPLTALAFGADGKVLATLGDDDRVTVWDVASGNAVFTLAPPKGSLTAMAFSPDGRQLALSDTTGWVALWDSHSGRQIKTMEAGSALILDVAYKPDASQIATAAYDGTIKVWNSDTGRMLYELSGHRNVATHVAFSPDGKHIATASADGTFRVWTTAPRGDLLTVPGVFENIAYSPDGRALLTTDTNGTVGLWDGTSGKPIQEASHIKDVSDVAFSSTGKIAAGGTDGRITIWDHSSGRQVCSSVVPANISERGSRIRRIVFSPDGKQVVSADYNANTATLWDANSCRMIHQLVGHSDQVLAAAFSPDGKRVATASKDRTAKLWDVASGQDLETFKGHLIGLVDIAFSPKGDRLVTASKDKTAKVWDLTAKEPHAKLTLAGHTNSVMAVRFSPDGRHIATGGLDKTIRIWDADSGKELETVTQGIQEIYALAFAPHGQRLAAVGENSAQVYTLSTQELLTLAGNREGRSLTNKECLQYLEHACPENTTDLMNDGRKLAREGKLESASKIFGKALKLNPSLAIEPEQEAKKTAGAFILLAASKFVAEAKNEADFEEAAKLLQAATILDPTIQLSPQTQLRRWVANLLAAKAENYARQDRISEAAKLFEQADKLDVALKFRPEQDARRIAATSHLFSAWKLRSSRHDEEAAKELDEAIKIDPGYPMSHRLLAEIYNDDEKYEKAIIPLRTASRLDPGPGVQFELVDVLRLAGHSDEARAFANETLRSYPGYRCGYLSLGLVERDTEHLQEALAAFRQVRDTDFCYGEAMSVSAATYFDKLGNREMAYQIYKQALLTDPENVGHIANFAEASLGTERYQEATELAKRALNKMKQQRTKDASISLAMRYIIIASLTLAEDEQASKRALDEFIQYYNSAGTYERHWTYTGSESFLLQAEIPAAKRNFLLKLLKVLKEPAGRISIEDFQ